MPNGRTEQLSVILGMLLLVIVLTVLYFGAMLIIR